MKKEEDGLRSKNSNDAVCVLFKLRIHGYYRIVFARERNQWGPSSLDVVRVWSVMMNPDTSIEEVSQSSLRLLVSDLLSLIVSSTRYCLLITVEFDQD
jgi:hypothetical protein